MRVAKETHKFLIGGVCAESAKKMKFFFSPYLTEEFPNWCGTCPMVVLTFLEQYDLTGKKIYSFVTNGGGGCGRSTEDIEKSVKGAEITESINGKDLSDDAIKQWLGL